MKDKEKLKKYQKEWYEKQKKLNSAHLKLRQAKNNKQKVESGRQKKIRYLLLKGGECSICGYKYDSTNAAAFDFHHVDIAEKEYSPSQILKYGEDKIQAELDKCILVCSNCHRLLHSSRY